MSIFGKLFHRQEKYGNTEEEAESLKDAKDNTGAFSPEENSTTAGNPGGGRKGTLKYETKDPETTETYEILEREILPAKIICPDCGGITLEGLEFCDKCGGELQ